MMAEFLMFLDASIWTAMALFGAWLVISDQGAAPFGFFTFLFMGAFAAAHWYALHMGV